MNLIAQYLLRKTLWVLSPRWHLNLLTRVLNKITELEDRA